MKQVVSTLCLGIFSTNLGLRHCRKCSQSMLGPPAHKEHPYLRILPLCQCPSSSCIWRKAGRWPGLPTVLIYPRYVSFMEPRTPRGAEDVQYHIGQHLLIIIMIITKGREEITLKLPSNIELCVCWDSKDSKRHLDPALSEAVVNRNSW